MLPDRLQRALRLRARAILKLQREIRSGGTGLSYCRLVSDLQRYILREWCDHYCGFDPIALGC